MARNKHPKISTIPSKGMKYRSPLSLIRKKNRKNDKCVSNNSNPSSEQKENLAAQ